MLDDHLTRTGLFIALIAGSSVVVGCVSKDTEVNPIVERTSSNDKEGGAGDRDAAADDGDHEGSGAEDDTDEDGTGLLGKAKDAGKRDEPDDSAHDEDEERKQAEDETSDSDRPDAAIHDSNSSEMEEEPESDEATEVEDAATESNDEVPDSDDDSPAEQSDDSSEMATSCEPDTERSCAMGGFLGSCAEGVQSCSSEGQWGDCSITALDKDGCAPGNDDDCDGEPNEDCECLIGESRSCGEDGAQGNCAEGEQSCDDGTWSDCSIQPTNSDGDTCLEAGSDDNCNGEPNEGCDCIAEEEQSCAASGAKGSCADGVRVCDDSGQWGECSIQPAGSDTCDPGNDDNCNGVPNEDCDCEASDPPLPCGATTDIGECQRGLSSCMNNQWGACQDAVYPAPRDCRSPDDNDCDGSPDNTEDSVCECVPGSEEVCEENTDVGACEPGTRTCATAPDYSSSSWEECSGVVGPSQELCDGQEDENCDGTCDEGCHTPIYWVQNTGGAPNLHTQSQSGAVNLVAQPSWQWGNGTGDPMFYLSPTSLGDTLVPVYQCSTPDSSNWYVAVNTACGSGFVTNELLGYAAAAEGDGCSNQVLHVTFNDTIIDGIVADSDAMRDSLAPYGYNSLLTVYGWSY